MKINRFFAEDMRQAIRQVREALGPDAVILSNKTVDGGVELVAAIDYDESAVMAAVESKPTAAPEEQPGVITVLHSKPEEKPAQKQNTQQREKIAGASACGVEPGPYTGRNAPGNAGYAAYDGK